jgi:mannose-6-phosphate isomerase-like protein (cupin superfamily)
MKAGAVKWLFLLTALTAAAPLGGCRTPRMKYLQARQPQDEHFEPAAVLSQMAARGRGPLAEVARAPGQHVCMLKLPAGGELKPRYHKRTDVTLVGVAGRAIIRVEDARYVLQPGHVVVVERMAIYGILLHEGDEDFGALMICSPSFDRRDIVLQD